MSLRKQAILLFCILMFCYSYVHQGLGWNQNSRLDLLRALFLHHTFTIDADHENTGDKSIHNGHYYSDKAPGIVFLAIPAFAASLAILDVLEVSLDSPIGWLASSWITTVGSVGLITALGGVAMFAFLCHLVGQRYAFITTLVVFLGSSPFPYATMLFSHAAVIGLICIALWAIADEVCVGSSRRQEAHSALRPFDAIKLEDRPTPSAVPSVAQPQATHTTQSWLMRYLLAGVCCGVAISSEYTAATAAGGVLMLAILSSWKRGVILAVGAVLPLLLTPIYNWACFGSPLAFGYHHLALTEFQGMNKGLFGITFPPKVSAAYLILLSPERGLFFWTPFFLMGFFGLKSLLKASRNLFSISCLVAILHVICISGYYMPGGGAALGPRHLAPMLPFVTIAAAFGLRRYRYLGYSYGAYSILLTGFATLIDALPPEDLTNPLIEFYAPRFLNGKFTNNLGFVLGLPAFLGVWLIVAVMIVPYIILCHQTEKSPQEQILLSLTPMA